MTLSRIALHSLWMLVTADEQHGDDNIIENAIERAVKRTLETSMARFQDVQ